MFEFAFVGVASGAGSVDISLSGSLSKTAAPSGTNVTSDTVTVSVPSGSSGQLTFASFSFSGTVGTAYSKNGGGFIGIVETDVVTFANGDTFAVRGSGMVAGESWTFSLTDVGAGKTLGPYTILAS